MILMMMAIHDVPKFWKFEQPIDDHTFRRGCERWICVVVVYVVNFCVDNYYCTRMNERTNSSASGETSWPAVLDLQSTVSTYYKYVVVRTVLRVRHDSCCCNFNYK